MIDFLIQYGYIGVFLAAFLAATVLPFGSEPVVVGVLAAGAEYVPRGHELLLARLVGQDRVDHQVPQDAGRES